MNLKEAFRFQNKLQSMMADAQSILGNNGNITKVQNTYLRHKVMAEVEDEVTMEAPSTEYSENITEIPAVPPGRAGKAERRNPSGEGIPSAWRWPGWRSEPQREAPGDRHSAPSHGRPAQWRGFDL